MRHLLSIVVLAALLLGGVSAVAVTAQSASLLDLLPAADEIGPAFAVVDSRSRTLAEQAAAFANPDEATRLLTEWEWQDNAFKVFARHQPDAIRQRQGRHAGAALLP